MKIFFTASFSGKAKYQNYFDMIVRSIEGTGVELISPEKGNYKTLLTETDIKRLKTDRSIHYEAIKKGILWADLVIIEISQQDFQLGHEATLAVQNKKPVLCLSLHEDFSIKIINRYFYGAKYNQYNVKTIIKDFIYKHQREILSERFNFFLSKSQLKFLETESAKAGSNASELLRRLIDRERSA